MKPKSNLFVVLSSKLSAFKPARLVMEIIESYLDSATPIFLLATYEANSFKHLNLTLYDYITASAVSVLPIPQYLHPLG